jgi:tRNA(fMet)-specific endonuclease VapC
VIVDTNVLVRVMQGHERATRKLAELEGQSIRLTLSAVSLFELYHSVNKYTIRSNGDVRSKRYSTRNRPIPLTTRL